MLRRLLDRVVVVSIDERSNSPLRELLLHHRIYGVVGSAFYRARRHRPKTLNQLSKEQERGYRWNFSKREINPQFRPNKCFSIARAHEVDVRRASVLVVGPRNFSELLLAWAHGFRWDRIKGLDLYSEHPKVVLGDLQDATTLPDEQYDVVVCSGVLNYCTDLPAAMKNLARLAAQGGVVVVQQDDLDDLGDDVPWSASVDAARVSILGKLALVDATPTFHERVRRATDDGWHSYAAFRP